MLTGVPLYKILAMVGHKHGTRTKELVRVIRLAGFLCPDRLTPSKSLMDKLVDVPRALVKMKYSFKTGWHWIAWIDGVVYDPSYFVPIKDAMIYFTENTKLSSFLAVTR